MPWSLKSGTLPDKVSALLVYDTSISEPVVMLGDGNIKTLTNDGVQEPSTDEPSYTACISGEWGFTESGKNIRTEQQGALDPEYLLFTTNDGFALPANDIRDPNGPTTWMLLINTARDIASSDNSLLWSHSATDGMGIGVEEANDFFTILREGSAEIVASNQTVPASGTPFCIAAHLQRINDASTNNELFYSTKASGSMSSVCTATANTGAGNDKLWNRWGRRPGDVAMDVDTYMVIVFNNEQISTGDMDTIIADPLGVLVETGGVVITSVSGDNIFADGDSGVPIVGTGFV